MLWVAFMIAGFCKLEVKPLGPVQKYTAPAMVLAVKLMVPPKLTGLFEPAVGVVGSGFTVTGMIFEAAEQPAWLVTLTW